MAIEVFAIKFTEEERALLRKRAKIEKMSEADYLRVCMLVDALMAGDRDAIKITAGRLREKFLARVRRMPHWADDLRGTPGLRRVKVE